MDDEGGHRVVHRSLQSIFLCHVGSEERGTLQGQNFEQDLQAMLNEAEAAWPTLRLDTEMFIGHIATRLDFARPEQMLGTLCVADLYLACACTLELAEGHRLVERRYASELTQLYLRTKSDVMGLDDFLQQVWERALTAKGKEAPRIAGYRGRGLLGSWLRMLGRRLLLNAIRDAGRKPRAVPDALLDRMVNETKTAHQVLERKESSRWFKAALSEALAELRPSERNLLRYRIVEGLSMEETARLTGMHRVSASRSLARVQQGLMRSVRRRVLRMAGSDCSFEQAFAELDSRFELSLSRLLAS